LDGIFSFLYELGPFLLYVFLGAGAALENFFPPVPADTFVLIGALMAAGGHGERLDRLPGDLALQHRCRAACLSGWVADSGSLSSKTGLGRHLLYPAQLRRMGCSTRRWGL
jgi:hypothetical protein